MARLKFLLMLMDFLTVEFGWLVYFLINAGFQVGIELALSEI